jgi:hypothetical protein
MEMAGTHARPVRLLLHDHQYREFESRGKSLRAVGRDESAAMLAAVLERS